PALCFFCPLRFAPAERILIKSLAVETPASGKAAPDPKCSTGGLRGRERLLKPRSLCHQSGRRPALTAVTEFVECLLLRPQSSQWTRLASATAKTERGFEAIAARPAIPTMWAG